MGKMLGIVCRVIATNLTKKAGHGRATARTGAITLIQPFGGALNINAHFHMLFLDAVYVDHPNGTARFRWVKAPSSQELPQLMHTIAHRVGRFLERQGLLERDPGNRYLALCGGRVPDKSTAGALHYLPDHRGPPARTQGVHCVHLTNPPGPRSGGSVW